MANTTSTDPMDWQDVFAGSTIQGGGAAAWQVGGELLNHVSAETRHMWRCLPLGQVVQAGGRQEYVVDTSMSYQVLDTWDCHVPEGLDEFTLIVRARVDTGDIKVRLREDGSTTVAEVTISSATTAQGSDTGSITTGARSYSIEVLPDDAGAIDYIMVVSAVVSI